jgi:hypothetical protein
VYAYAQEIYRNIAKSNIELFSKCLVLKIIVSVLLGLNFTSHLYDHVFAYSKSVLIKVCKFSSLCAILGNLLFWLKGYPSRRKQRVVIKDAISSTGELKADVPQGSVLGTLLFLYFIKDVADNMTGFGKLFADDTCIGHMAHNEENLHTLIRTDLEYSNTWS